MKNILVIENEIQTRDLLLNSLKSEDFYTIGADNGIVGIQLVRKYLPDLVLCDDILMPELDGYGVLRALRQDPATAIIPLIFLTTKFTDAKFRKGMNLGADDYISKPWIPEELFGAIAARLEKQTALKQWYLNQYQSVKHFVSPESTKLLNLNINYPTNSRISKVFEYIEENYNQQITLSDLARVVGYSNAYLSDLVKRETQLTINEWIVERRMVEARSLLIKTDKPINQIAANVGYTDTAYFIRSFRHIHKLPPKEWRKASRIQLVA